MIPKKIHQIYFPWNGPFEDIPIFVKSRKIILDLHPDWEYKLWGEEESLELVRQHAPDMELFYLGLRYNIQRVDFIKFLVLKVHGGFYVDLDSYCIKPFDDLIGKRFILHTLQHMLPDHKEFVQNDFMASEPNFKFWDIIFKEIVTNYNEKSSNPIYDQWKGRFVLQTTGPRFLSRVVKNVLPSYKPHKVVWTKWRNNNWERFDRNDYYFESFQTGSWLSDVSPSLKANKLFNKNENREDSDR